MEPSKIKEEVAKIFEGLLMQEQTVRLIDLIDQMGSGSTLSTALSKEKTKNSKIDGPDGSEINVKINCNSNRAKQNFNDPFGSVHDAPHDPIRHRSP